MSWSNAGAAQPLSPLERGELEARAVARELRAWDVARGELGFEPWLGAWALLHAHELGQPRHPSPLEERRASQARREALRALLADSPAWSLEPHALGWLHQYYHEPERAQSFQAHTRHEAKHAQSTVSTQLYTPRWMADALARRGLALLEPGRAVRVLDPAAGCGQLLLAAADALLDRGLAADADQLSAALWGVELDPVARHVALLSLEHHMARRFGPLDQATRARLARQIILGDGLRLPSPKGAQGFELVLSNPPYMGARAMPAALKAQLERQWRPFHLDLYVAFMARCLSLSVGVVGLLTQQTVWYLASFERARDALLERAALLELIHIGSRAFQSLSGHKANVTLTLHQVQAQPSGTRCLDLRQAPDAASKRQGLVEWIAALESGQEAGVWLGEQERRAMPAGAPIYWLQRPLRRALASWPTLGELVELPGGQNKTGDNRRFVRPWRQVPAQALWPTAGLWPAAGHSAWRQPEADARAQTPLVQAQAQAQEQEHAQEHAQDQAHEHAIWRFYSKGGPHSPWWGNWTEVVDWSASARAFYASHATSNLLDARFWQRSGLCYTDFGGQRFNARWLPEGCVFDMAGPAMFVRPELAAPGSDAEHELLLALLALLNCAAPRTILNALNPSIHYQVRDLRRLPVPALAGCQAELAAHAQAQVALVRDLHRLRPEDPLYDPGFEADVEALSDRLLAQTIALEALVAQLYEVAPEAPEPPLHHLLRRPGR